MKYHKSLVLLSLVFVLLSVVQCKVKRAEEGGTSDATSKEVNVYTHRHYPADEEILKEFTRQTGIKVNVHFASADQLMQRLKLEGEKSPADVLITVDGSRLYKAVKSDLLQKVQSPILNRNIPEKFRHPEGYCFSLTYRGRVIMYAKDRVDPSKLSTYEALADPQWEEKVLIRSSANVYNQSLLSSIIVSDGALKAKNWAKGLTNNFARAPKGNDRDQIKGVAAGLGDVAVANTYYLGILANSKDAIQKDAAQKVKIFFPNQGPNEKGTHVNISGAGVTKYAPNKANAIKLLEFLSSKPIQEKFASINYEYPVNPEANWHPMLKSWGTFKTQEINFYDIGKLQEQAKDIFNQVGWK